MHGQWWPHIPGGGSVWLQLPPLFEYSANSLDGDPAGTIMMTSSHTSNRDAEKKPQTNPIKLFQARSMKKLIKTPSLWQVSDVRGCPIADNCLCVLFPRASGQTGHSLDFHLLKGQLVWSFLFLFYYDITRVKCGEVRPGHSGVLSRLSWYRCHTQCECDKTWHRDTLQMEGAGWRGQEALCGGGGQAEAAPPAGQWVTSWGFDD